MHGIADIIARDGMQRIILVIGLVTRSRHPDNARVTVGADHINNGLEEVMQRLGRVLAVLVKNGHRLVSQFYEELPTVFFHFGIRTDGIPHIHQVFLIFPAHLNRTGTHAGRTHHHVKPMFHSRFGQRDKERAQIFVQSHSAETADVGFSCFRPLDGQVGIVCPTRIQMQAEDVAPSSLGRVGQCRKELVKILTAFQDVARCLTRVSPTVIVEVRIRRVHHAMQVHDVPMRVFQVFAIHMQRWHLAILCP